MFRDAVGKDDFGGNAIFRQHFFTLLIVPRAGQLLFYRRAPFVVDLLDQKLLFSLVHHVDLNVHRHVDEVVILRFDIRLVLMDRQAGMAIG